MAILLLACGAAGYYWGHMLRHPGLPPALPVSRGVAAGFNVVLFTLDTLRADYLGCYGHPTVETPVLDALAAGGVRCTDAVTAAPLTLPAHCTILTGNYPLAHGVRTNGAYRLPDEQVTLAERLKEAGYATAAFLGAFVLDGRFGTNQGFDVYKDEIDARYRTPGQARDIPQQPGNVVTDAALEWLDTHHRHEPDRPFFMWVHLFDPHAPYEPPEPFATRYAADLYGGEVAFTDQQVGRTVERLRELGLLERTLIVAVSDHGEGLGEHGEKTHSILIYESTMWVPLIFYCPAVLPAGLVLDDRVVTVADIMPTVLDLLGLRLEPCDGLSLLRAGAPADRAVYIETLAPRERGWSPLRGLRRLHDKYIEAPTPEYYDLSTDRREERNLYADSGPAAELRDQLAKLLAAFPAEQEAAHYAPDAEALQKLAALGYVGGRAITLDGPPIDPKDVIAPWEHQWELAWRALGEGRYRDAISALEALLTIAPGDGDAWATLSKMQAWEGLLDQAIDSRLRAIELEPNKVHNWVDLAQLQRQKGDLRGMEASLAEAERIEPDHGDIYLVRASVALEQQRYFEALALCEEARRRDPSRRAAAACALQARTYEAMGLWEEAEAAYRRGLASDPRDPDVLVGLMKLMAYKGQYDQVIELGQRVEPHERLWAEARRVMAVLYLHLGQYEEAVATARQLVQRSPTSAWAYMQLSYVLRMLERTDEALAAARQAVTLAPHDPHARHELAEVLLAAGDVEAGMAHLRRAVELQPGHRPALERLIELLEAQGQSDEAAQLRALLESLNH